jgi:hypothetical protein
MCKRAGAAPFLSGPGPSYRIRGCIPGFPSANAARDIHPSTDDPFWIIIGGAPGEVRYIASGDQIELIRICANDQ